MPAFSAEKVEILRDEFGNPHIFAHSAAGAAYGSGYAQMEDRAEQVLANLKNSSQAALQLPPAVLSLVEGYCAGINAWLAENHRNERVKPQMVEEFSRRAFGLIGDSNDVLISPARSNEKSVIAILSPITRWYGAGRLYEIHVSAPEVGLEFSGVAPVGIPFPLLGHSAFVSIAGHGVGVAGPRALEQAWAMIGAHSLEEMKSALALGQFSAQKFLIGTSEGDIYDSGTGTANPPAGVLLSGGGVRQAAAMTRKLVEQIHQFSIDSAVDLAFSTDVFKAEEWQKRIAATDPGLDFARLLTGWSRRADATSRPALAFYLFKMALGDDSSALEPPSSLSDSRLRAALRKAQDRLETEFPVDATYGTLFRVARDGSQHSFPLGGGTVAAAGMATPWAVDYEARDRRMVARGGLAALQVAVLSKPARSVMVLPLGESDQPGSPHFEDQARELFSLSRTYPTYFGDRKNLEKHSKNAKKELIF